MSIVRIESAMDWVQFSAPGSTILADEMSHFAHELRQQEERAGYLAKNMQVHGYFGWSVGSVAFLVHEQRERVMLKVSSDLCAVHQAYLAALGIENGSSVTRVDLQATVWYAAYMPGVAEDLGRRVLTVRAGRTSPRATYINGLGNGDTTYIGAPSSDKRVRVYDKYKESGGEEDYLNAWRYEVQYRSTYAHEVLKQLNDAIEVGERVAAIINGEFKPYDFTVVPDVRAVQRPKGMQRNTDIERRLQWLKNQVGPATREVAYEVGWDTIMDILKGY